MGHSTKSKRKPPKKTGRKSLYDPDEHPRVARQLTGEGKTKQDVAEYLNIARSTLDEWRAQHIAFSVAFDLGAEDATDRVERSLLERAIGYKVPVVKPMSVAIGDGCSTIQMVDVIEHYPPDVAAAKFVLTNRRRKFWSDKQKIEHSGTLTLEQMLTESWKKSDEKNEQAEAPKGDA